ncbi:TetR family transcriptional regulator [Mycolicibacterium elephantis]|uniref:TetR family transcriptional regulator n=1 Tax=Mycolicibacterium elephantis TaxID=81858 RepID=A0A0M2ZQH5_9MYCO|nr:TetR family transcriptional regulator [Mycolicibacterium elephantis]KKW66053.1 TetR family transcriptional regulator [Mycolicibacterium elephantis]OBB18730.1 TetR family transcriptional regulator [Mycolicibacterium elephantis]ORA65265.1 TetR family transcriptional regulator [Mycolicibacterium elephantis]
MAKTASAPARKRRDRGSISADEIINGAFEVAAEVSIDNLSMPQLAKHLGVGVTSIYWYFRRKDDLLDAMADRALEEFEFTVPTIAASNWRESLRDHALTMRRRFRADPILCDLVLIRGQYGQRAMHDALQKLAHPIGALVEAGLSAEQAAETYGAISVHIRGSVVLERLQERTEGFPAQRTDGGRYIGFADDIDFGYILDSILDHAEAIIAAA